jgi:tetratricopeptide (TPR) repeat protein
MKSKFLILLLFGILKVGAQTSTFFRVDSLFERGRYKLALSQLEKIEKSSFLSNYKTAVIYESIDNYTKTILFLEKSLAYKNDYKAKLKLAKAYLKINKPSKTINIYESILTKDSLNLVLKYQLGLSFSLINDRDRMINSFLDSHDKDSTHLKSIIRLASSFNKLNDKDSTQIFIDKGLLIDSNHIALNKLNINQLYRDKKYQVAIVSLLKLDTVLKNDAYVASMLGRSYYNLDSLNKADEYFRKLYYIDNDNYKSYTYHGHIASKKKKFKDAETLYRMATYIGKEKRDEEFYSLATVNYELKKAKQALFYFDRAFKENIKNYKAL